MMLRKFLVILFLLLAACAPPTDFSRQGCIDRCTQCGIDVCDQICTSLDEGFQSTNCHQPSEQVWECALVAECEFPTTCSYEITEFLGCQPAF